MAWGQYDPVDTCHLLHDAAEVTEPLSTNKIEGLEREHWVKY